MSLSAKRLLLKRIYTDTYLCCVFSLFSMLLFYFRMAPEVIACDENPDATYDNRVSFSELNKNLSNKAA